MKITLPVLDYRPWSPSKLDLASRCPRAFKYRYVDKIKTEVRGSAAKVGTTAHRAQELTIEGLSTKEAFDAALKQFEKELTTNEIEKVQSFAPAVDSFNEFLDAFKTKHRVVKVLAEHPLAINADFEPCDYADPSALIRGILDLVLLLESGQVVIIDHKSGKRKPVEEYSSQLDTYAILALANFKEVKAVQCAIHFMAHEKVEWHALRRRNDIISIFHPWLVTMMNSRASGLEGFTPKVRAWTCGWCDFLKVCPEGNNKNGQGEGDRSSTEGSQGSTEKDLESAGS